MRQHIESLHSPVMPPFTPSVWGRAFKLLISSAFYVGRELIESIRRCLGHQPRPAAVAIYYHQVPSERRALFARQMDRLLRCAVPVRADRVECLRGATRYAMVTADDGWLSFIENAVPELERRRIPVTIFAISDYLGQSMGDLHDRLATENELRSICSDLVCVGSHTSTHARLTAVDEEAAWAELRDSRTRLEDILGREIKLFSFPFSVYNSSLIGTCRNAGYSRVFIGTPSPALRQPEEFVTSRIRVDPTDWALEFHLKLMGAYHWMPWAINLKRRISSLIWMRAMQWFVRSRGQINPIGDDSNATLIAERRQPVEDAVRPTAQRNIAQAD